MDYTSLGFFLIAAFLGGLTSGLSGFAMGLGRLRNLAASHYAKPERASHRALWIGYAGLRHLARPSRDQVGGGDAVHRWERRGCRYRDTAADHNRPKQRASHDRCASDRVQPVQPLTAQDRGAGSRYAGCGGRRRRQWRYRRSHGPWRHRHGRLGPSCVAATRTRNARSSSR